MEKMSLREFDPLGVSHFDCGVKYFSRFWSKCFVSISFMLASHFELLFRNYTTVDKREEPMDSVDALLFWINKICLLVRDDMEKCQAMRKDPNQCELTVLKVFKHATRTLFLRNVLTTS